MTTKIAVFIVENQSSHKDVEVKKALKHLQERAEKFDKIEALWTGQTDMPEGSDIIHELESIMLD